MAAVTPDTATSSARRIHDPGAKRILVLIVNAGPTLKAHAQTVATATNFQPGTKPRPGAPKPDAGALLQAIGDVHADLQSLRSTVKRVACRTRAGRHGKALILQSLTALDQATQTFAMAVAAPDRATKGARMLDTQRFNKQAKEAARAARPLLER